MEVPQPSALAELLDAYAPLSPVPLCPELKTFHARSLVEIWDAAESLAGGTLNAPFWAWPWAAGQALARVILDQAERVRGRHVLDFGAGGGVASLACARAGASRVIASDVDPWAIAVTRIAAERQGLLVEAFEGDPSTDAGAIDGVDLILCSDLGYDRSTAPREREFLDQARRNGLRVLVADAGRTYFDPAGLRLISTCEVIVPQDLEGATVRTARVYEG